MKSMKILLVQIPMNNKKKRGKYNNDAKRIHTVSCSGSQLGF